MEVQFTPKQQALVRQAIASGRLRDEGDAVREALSLWENRERALAELDEAEATLEQGGGRSITWESMRELAEEVKRELRARRAAKNAASH